ncbi:MAG: hypothetical protein RLZ12_636 [Bacillota bacterium]|jgi:cyclopropane fatty-acyl-phospholipid synthase-like methyltransferase
MLKLHLSEETELASRKKNFINRSVDWITAYFKLNCHTKVCDFGCGPGLYTSSFAENGAQVTGLDFSKNSIAYAAKQAKKNNLQIAYILQDYLTFNTTKKFDLITMIYCDFCVLNPQQRDLLLQKFHSILTETGRVLLDVSSLATYADKQETSTYEYIQNGFWSANSHYVFHNTFKYKKELLLLDKFTIIEESKIRESYNWLQCYNIQTISSELQQNNLKLVDYFSNVAGDKYDESATEIALVIKKI